MPTHPELNSDRLKSPWPEQKLDNIAFVRLQPIELDGRDSADIQAVDVVRVDQLPLPFLIFSDGAADQSRADLLEHLLLRALDNGYEREHELGIGKRLCR